MKKLRLYFSTLLFLSLIFCFAQCEKEKPYLNITLVDKPTSTIQAYIRGRWYVQYASGGICGSCKFDRQKYHEYYEFGSNRRIVHTFQNSIKLDTIYDWISYQGPSSDYNHHIIGFNDEVLQSFLFEPIEIRNDTLILAQPFSGNPDYMLLLLTKDN